MESFDLLLFVGLLLLCVAAALTAVVLGVAAVGASCVFVWLVAEADE